MNMKKFLSASVALAIAASSTIAFAGPAEARHRHHNDNGDEIAAGILGFALGAVVAGTASNYYYAPRRNYYYTAPAPYPRRYYAPRAGYYADPGMSHVQRCEYRYRSYDRYSDTFIGRDGRRYYCNL